MMTLACGLAVLEPDQDALLSRWVERDRDLSAYDARIRDVFCPMIPRGGVVVDAGACLGSHTVAYADAVGPSGRVLAFEPNPAVAACLRWNTRELLQVEVWPVALSCRVWKVGLATSDYNAGGSTIRDHAHLRVPALPLDEIFIGPRLDYLKLDVEGHEHEVLLGATETIRRAHPVIVMEVGHSPDAVPYLQSLGYQCQRLPTERPDQPIDEHVYDVIGRWVG
jgi:FkbM family methyltransferase